MTTTILMIPLLIIAFLAFLISMAIATCAELIIATIVYIFDFIVGLKWKKFRGYRWMYLYEKIRMFFSKILLSCAFAIISIPKIARLYMKKHPKEAEAYIKRHHNKRNPK